MITVENIDKQGRMSMSLESFLLKKKKDLYRRSHYKRISYGGY